MNASPEERQQRHQSSGEIPQSQQLESQNSNGSQQPNAHGSNTTGGPKGVPSSDPRYLSHLNSASASASVSVDAASVGQGQNPGQEQISSMVGIRRAPFYTYNDTTRTNANAANAGPLKPKQETQSPSRTGSLLSDSNTNDGPAADAKADGPDVKPAAASMGTNSTNRGRMIDQQELDLESRIREGRQNYPDLSHSNSQASANTLVFQQLQMQHRWQQQQQQELYYRPQMFQNYQNPGNYWPTRTGIATDSRFLMQNMQNYQSQFPYHSAGASVNGNFGQPLNLMNYRTGIQSSAPNHMQHQGATTSTFQNNRQIILKDAINKHDVLCGRGGDTNTHVGNISYREMVNRYKAKYLRAPKKQKPSIALEIVENIRNLEPPGRFLKKVKVCEGYNIVGDHVVYEIVGDKDAVQKACQSLREGSAKRNQNDFKYGDSNIDSDLSAKTLEAPTQTFETHCKQLEEFKANHGHLRITPLLDGKLCAYCQQMRQFRRNETISREMIEKLDALGFDWEFQPQDDDSKLPSRPEPVAGDKRKLKDCGPTKDEHEPSEEPEAKKNCTIKVDEHELSEESEAKKNCSIKVDEHELSEESEAKKNCSIKVDEHELSEESEAKTNGTIKVDEPSKEPEVQKRSLFFWPKRFLKGFAR